MVWFEDEAFPRVVWPETVSTVAVVVAKVVVPVTKVFPDTERAVVDAVANVVWPEMLRVVSVAKVE